MRCRISPILKCLVAALLLVESVHAAPIAQLNLSFEENRGQAPASARFLARGQGYHLILTADGNRVLLRGGLSLSARLVGASPDPQIRGEQKLAGKIHYLTGNRPLTNIATYARVRYDRVYPGIDLVYYGNQKQLEYDFIVKPGSDPRSIQMRFGGADAIRLDDKGNLVLHAGDAEILQLKPVVYQEVGASRRRIQGEYRLLSGDTIGFEIGPYDTTRTLVIDPVLSYSTFLGGSNGDDDARAVATDASGNVYIAGTTTSTNFQLRAPFQPDARSDDPESGLSDGFVTKINAAGTALIYSTYIGGTNDDDASAIAVDASGNVIIAGSTASTSDFPTTAGAIRRTCNTASNGTCLDAFVAKLNAAGSALVYSTYLGGNGDDEGRAAALDSSGNAYITGKTASTNFTTTAGAYSTDSASGGFVTKLSATGGIVYSTYFGAGPGTTEPKGIAVDSAGNAYVTGASPSSTATGTDVFVTKLNSTGTLGVYSQFIRGAKDDAGQAIAVDSSGSAYVAGQTSSIDFLTTPGVLQREYGGGPAFRTADAGANWSAGSAGISRASLYSLAITPGNASTLYAGADDENGGGVFKTTDGGSSWSNSSTGLTDARVHALAVDPANTSIVYAGTRSAGVFKSTDGGATWSATSLATLFVTAITIDPVTPATVYAGTEANGVYKSTNGGTTWAAAGNNQLSVGVRTLAINRANPATLYAGTGGGIYRTSDGGATWTPMSSGLFDPNINVLIVDPANPNRLFAGTNSVGVFRSTNAGVFWLSSNSGLVSSGSGILVTALAIDSGTGTLYAAVGESNVSRVYKSANGITWVPTNLATARVTSLAVDGSSSNNVYAATVGGADAFVAKWNASGSLVFASYLGGYRDDAANAIAIDSSGSLHVAGETSSTNFPSVNAVQTTFGGGSDVVTDAFVSKVNASATALMYSSYLGGSGNDFGKGVAVDTTGGAYVVGATGSGDFPTTTSALTRTQPGLLDAFVAKISDTYVVPARGGVSMSTQGQGAAIGVGYGRIQPSTGMTTPSALAIFGYRPNNVLVTEAAVPASSLISAGRMYAEVGTGATTAVNTGVAIANPNDTPARVDFYFTDRAGQSFGSGNTTIPANGQIAKFLDEAPFNSGTGLSDSTFTFTSTSPVAAIALRGFTNERGEFLITTLPVADLSVAEGTESILFPHFTDGAGWTTQILLVNTTDAAMTGSVEFYSAGTAAASGQITGTPAGYNIPPRSSVKVRTSGAGTTVTRGSVRVLPGSGSRTPTGVAVFAYNNGAVTVTEAGVPALRVSTAFRLYAESSGVSQQIGSIQTGVAVANPSTTPVNVTFELTSLTGVPMGQAASATVPGNGQIAMFLNEIGGFGALPNPFQGVLRVSTSSSTGIAVVGLRARYNERRDVLITTTQPTDETRPASTAEQFFPHLADGGGFTTQFILFNGSVDQASSGSLRFFAQSGQSLNLTVR